MKRNVISSALLLSMLMVGCQSDNGVEPTIGKSVVDIEVTANVEADKSDIESKVGVVEDGEGFWRLSWENEDSVIGWCSDNSAYKLSVSKVSGKAATFKGSATANTSMRLIYPFDGVAAQSGAYSIDLALQRVDMSNDDELMHFGDNNLYMISDSFSVDASDYENPTMKHLLAGMKLAVTGSSEYAGKVIGNVVIKGLSSFGAINLAGVDPVLTGTEGDIMLNVANGAAVSDGAVQNIPFSVIPFSVGAGEVEAITIEVYFADGSKATLVKDYLSVSAEIAAGSVNTLAVDLSAATSDATTYILSQFSGDMTLPTNDVWYITDVTTTAATEFDGLEAALVAAQTAGRKIHVVFSEMTNIPDKSFQDCTALTSIEIHKLTSWGTWVFAGCSNLTEVIFPTEGNFTIHNQWFNSAGLTEIEIPANCTSVNYGAFTNCKSLVSANINTPMIGDKAFDGCTALKYVTLSDNVTSLTGTIFNTCTSLTEFKVNWMATPPAVGAAFLPVSFKVGGANVVLIPVGANVDDYVAAGWGVYNLVQDDVVISTAGNLDAAMRLRFGAGYATGAPIEKLVVCGEMSTADFAALQNVKDLDISRVTTKDIDPDNNSSTAAMDNALPPYAFSSNTANATSGNNKVLERIVLPTNLRSIGFCAFAYCTSLTDGDNFVLPTGTTYYSMANRGLDCMSISSLDLTMSSGVSYRGCANNASLKSAKLGSSATGMANEAFFGCNNMTELEVSWTEGIPNVATTSPLPGVFNTGGTAWVKIPDGDGIIDLYIASGWGKYNLYNAENPKE